jgi:hypothetical protein
MRGTTTLLALTLALAVATPGQGATLIDTRFAEGTKGWVLNGEAKLARAAVDANSQILELTSNKEEQIGVAWTELKQKVPSFTFIADVRVDYYGEGYKDCPGDGFTLVFAPAKTDTVGVHGGSLGLFHSAIERFTAFEVNTYPLQGLRGAAAVEECKSGQDVTFAFDVIHPEAKVTVRNPGMNGTLEDGGAKIGQVTAPEGMQIVNGGHFRYQWNVSDDGTMAVYVTGLDDANRKFQKVKVLQVKMARNPVDFEGRFGLTAATGGALQTVEVARVRVESPMVEP